MKRRPKVEPYAVPRWMAPALQVLRPKKRLPVSVWAEANRILPDTNAVASPWRNALTPYLIEIMDAFSDDTTEQIVFVKPTQVGGTFLRTQQALVGAGQGLSYEAVSRDMKGSTYSNARQNAVEFATDQEAGEMLDEVFAEA